MSLNDKHTILYQYYTTLTCEFDIDPRLFVTPVTAIVHITFVYSDFVEGCVR